MSNTENPWTITSQQTIYDNPWINLTEFQVINPAGGNGIYGKVSFKNHAIGIIPIDEEQYTWLVGQYRFTLDDYSWEIPMGGGPRSDDLLTSAQRELKEETGIRANSWENILTIHTSNSVTDEVGYIFLARDLTFGEQELEETESDLKVWRLPFREALRMAENSEITDSLSLAGIFKVARMLNL